METPSFCLGSILYEQMYRHLIWTDAKIAGMTVKDTIFQISYVGINWKSIIEFQPVR